MRSESSLQPSTASQPFSPTLYWTPTLQCCAALGYKHCHSSHISVSCRQISFAKVKPEDQSADSASAAVHRRSIHKFKLHALHGELWQNDRSPLYTSTSAAVCAALPQGLQLQWLHLEGAALTGHAAEFSSTRGSSTVLLDAVGDNKPKIDKIPCELVNEMKRQRRRSESNILEAARGELCGLIARGELCWLRLL